MKILVSYRGIPQSPGWATGDLVVKAFRALGHEAYPYAKFYQENHWVEGRPSLDRHDWDLLLFLECNDGDPQYPELRVTRARKTACWLFDTSYHPDRYRSLVNYFGFDHIFLANPITVQEYKVWGYDNVSYLPYACDPDLHSRPLDYNKSMDVALVGSIREDRKRLAAQLKKEGINLELVSGKFREEYIDALASAKIVINQNPDAGLGLLNMRFFEGSAAGSVVFTEKRDYTLNYNAGFVCPRFTYDNIDELAKSIKFLLDDEEHRKYIAMRDQANVLEFNTYRNRCETIFETIYND